MERRNKNCNGCYYDRQHKNYIYHPVSKFDTLVGIAIKYGVEVADLKKMNGLSTDRQMFGLKSLQIPLPGKHPPSNAHEIPGRITCNQDSEQLMHLDPFDSFQSLRITTSPERKVSPAMSSLQGYYGLKPTAQSPISERFEMMVYRNGKARNLGNWPLFESFPNSRLPLDSNRRSKSYANVYLAHPDELNDYINITDVRKSESDNWNKKLVRRRQITEANLASQPPETVLEENGCSDGLVVSPITGKSLSPRHKSTCRSVSAAEAVKTGLSPAPFVLGDSLLGDQISGVRKSSSTSNLQHQSPIWPASKWDLQALSAVAIAKPILDGLPSTISGRRNKTALD